MASRPSDFPLNFADQGSIDMRTSPSERIARYKVMLGPQSASVDVGLAFQLAENTEETLDGVLDGSISKYDTGERYA